MSLQRKKVLVIGGAGFIGSHVVDELLKEDVKEVLIYDNFCRGTRENLKEALKDPRCSIFEDGGDILRYDTLVKAMIDMDCVVHLAALWLLHCQKYPESAFEVNVKGTFNVLRACSEMCVERLVYSSSASVYGDAIEEPMTEEHPYNNWTFYGATKIASEHLFKAYHNQYGLDGACLRYMNVYGPRQGYGGAYTALIMKVLDLIERGEAPFVYGDGSQAYDFVYVKDVARANVLALKASGTFGFYNVGTGIKISVLEVVKQIFRIIGSPERIDYKPAGQTFVTNRVGSTEKALRDLGFRHMVRLEEGLKELIEWRKK